jgi:hypothetical protein
MTKLQKQQNPVQIPEGCVSTSLGMDRLYNVADYTTYDLPFSNIPLNISTIWESHIPIPRVLILIGVPVF